MLEELGEFNGSKIIEKLSGVLEGSASERDVGGKGAQD